MIMMIKKVYQNSFYDNIAHCLPTTNLYQSCRPEASKSKWAWISMWVKFDSFRINYSIGIMKFEVNRVSHEWFTWPLITLHTYYYYGTYVQQILPARAPITTTMTHSTSCSPLWDFHKYQHCSKAFVYEFKLESRTTNRSNYKRFSFYLRLTFSIF